MIKKFSEHINEDYFSKLASRKEGGEVRKENQLPNGFVDLGLSVAFGPKLLKDNTSGFADLYQYGEFLGVVNDSEYDAPTKEQLQELIDNCDFTYDKETKIITATSKINGNTYELVQAEHRMPKGYGADAIQCLIWSTTNCTYSGREAFMLEATCGGKYNLRVMVNIRPWPYNYNGEFIPVIKLR